MNARMTMDDAVQNRLEEPKLHEKLKKRIQQVTRFPYSIQNIFLFQALKKDLPRDQNLQLFDA